MSAKKWLLSLGLTVLGLFLLLAAFNYIVDPYNAFGDRFITWDAYTMTQNPRTAKINYLDRHWQEYDSYIVGCSSTSAYPVETLNRYFDASFYNMIMYGADMLDVENECRYILENYRCENLVVNVYIDNAQEYDSLPDPLTHSMLPRVDGGSALAFDLRYLLCKPTYALDKLLSLKKDTYLKQDFDAFLPETGEYDKRQRDAENIGSRETYLQEYPYFADYPVSSPDMTEIRTTAESLGRIRDLCQEKGVRFLVVFAPVYGEYFDDFDPQQVAEYYRAVAEMTDFWDFSVSSVSYEMRYFYDATHFRNCVGDMALARIFGDESVYVPEDFGVLVTAENVSRRLQQIYAACALPEESISANVPILMYHHLDPQADGSNSMAVTPAQFDRQMAALKEAGYTAVSPEQLRAYVQSRQPLPEQPVLITFDDGYYSNYEYAFPILQKYGMKATIFVIGSSVGHMKYYKDTQFTLTPHFGEAEIREMQASGLITIQSHTYDMHQTAKYETGPARETVLALPGETEEHYISALQEDLRLQRQLLEDLCGEIWAMAYPCGLYDDLSRTVLHEDGIAMTVTTDPGENVILKGVEQSLMDLNRYLVTEDTAPRQLLEMVAAARG